MAGFSTPQLLELDGLRVEAGEPCSTTKMASPFLTVARRCATMSVVICVFWETLSKAAVTWRSLSVSSALLASSSKTSGL